MRILGSTSQSQSLEKEDDPLRAMQEAVGPDTDRERNNAELAQKTPKSSSVKVRASTDNPVSGATEDHSRRQSEAVVVPPMKHESSSEINIAATEQSSALRKMVDSGLQSDSTGMNKFNNPSHGVQVPAAGAPGEPLVSKRTFEPSSLGDRTLFTEEVPLPSGRVQDTSAISPIAEQAK